MQDAASGLEKGMIHHSEMETGFTPLLKMLKYKAEVWIYSAQKVELDIGWAFEPSHSKNWAPYYSGTHLKGFEENIINW